MEDILVYEARFNTVIFEPRRYVGEYVEARTGLNNLSFEKKICPHFQFLRTECRDPTKEERAYYLFLKAGKAGTICQP